MPIDDIIFYSRLAIRALNRANFDTPLESLPRKQMLRKNWFILNDDGEDIDDDKFVIEMVSSSTIKHDPLFVLRQRNVQLWFLNVDGKESAAKRPIYREYYNITYICIVHDCLTTRSRSLSHPLLFPRLSQTHFSHFNTNVSYNTIALVRMHLSSDETKVTQYSKSQSIKRSLS